MNPTYQFIQSHQSIEDIRSTFPECNTPIIEFIWHLLKYFREEEYSTELYEEFFQLIDDAFDTEVEAEAPVDMFTRALTILDGKHKTEKQTMEEESEYHLLEMKDLLEIKSSRGYELLIQSNEIDIHGICMFLYALMKAIDAAKYYPSDESWHAYGEAREAISHGRLFMAMNEEMEDDLEQQWVEKYSRNAPNKQGGEAAAKLKQNKRQEFVQLSEAIARKVWGVYPNISHKNLAQQIKDALDAAYPEPLKQQTIPSIRIISKHLKDIAPEYAPSRQAEHEIVDDLALIMKLIKDSIRETSLKCK